MEIAECQKAIKYQGEAYPCGHEHPNGKLICSDCAGLYRAVGMTVQMAKRWGAGRK